MAGIKRPPVEAAHPQKISKQESEEELALNCSYVSLASHELTQLRRAWRSKTPTVTATGCELMVSPFPCCLLPSFIEGGACEGGGGAGCLKNELLQLKFNEKSNDLYQFRQTNDLSTYHSPSITQFRSLLCDQFLPWLQELTGIPLTDTIDLFCSKYEHTDHLLCHDDQLEGRRIAFIYYLVPPWTVKDGGTLDLYATEGNGCPGHILHSIVPSYNCFVFFEVSPQSFHQVSEVLTVHKTRLAVSGWFHGTADVKLTPYKEAITPGHSPIPLSIEILESWVNPLYLDVGVQEHIREQFENESQIELQDFLLEDQYQNACEALTKLSDWTVEGPPNRKHTHTASNGVGKVKELKELFTSEPFCLLLTHLTGLDLVEEELRPKPRQKQSENGDDATTNSSVPSSSWTHSSHSPAATVTFDLYHWQCGDYTLLSDSDGGCGLDGTLYFGCEGWSEEFGGYTTYIAKEEDEELLTIIPSGNSLALVYHTNETVSFTKLINHRSNQPPNSSNSYYTCQAVYQETEQSGSS